MGRRVKLGELADSYSSENYLRWWKTSFEEYVAPGVDSDRDGATNYLEFITGTDPLDPESVWHEPVEVRTFAGSRQGGADGNRLEAEFNVPVFVDVDSKDQIWIVENTVDATGGARVGAHRVRMIDTAGRVRTVAGGPIPGGRDGPGLLARFCIPNGVAVDADGNAFVADRGNHRIRKITSDGVVSTLAGSSRGFANGKGVLARFNEPSDLCLDQNGNLYVADFLNRRVRRVSADGNVETVQIDFRGTMPPGNSQLPGQRGTIDDLPNGVSIDPFGHLMVTYWSVDSQIYWVDEEGVASVFLRGFSYPSSPRISGDGSVLLALAAEKLVAKVSRRGRVMWSLQLPLGTTMPAVDGSVREATFGGRMFGVAELPNGNILTCDAQNHRIRELVMGSPALVELWPPTSDFDRQLSVRAQSSIPGGVIRFSVDGSEPTVESAIFSEALLVDQSVKVKALLFVDDLPVSLVREETYSRRYSSKDGIDPAWKFRNFGESYEFIPDSIAVADPDGDGVSNFLEFRHGTDPSDYGDFPLVPTAVIGLDVQFAAGARSEASRKLKWPYRFHQSASGDVYLTERSVSPDGLALPGAHQIQRVSLEGTVELVAGGIEPGFLDGVGSDARFRGPSDVISDESGRLFLSDTFNNRIRLIHSDGRVKTIAGSTPGNETGVGLRAKFREPTRLGWNSNGDLLVLDSGNRALKRIDQGGEVSLVLSIPQGLNRVTEFVDLGRQGWLFGEHETGRVVQVDIEGQSRSIIETEPLLWTLRTGRSDRLWSVNSFLGTGRQEVSQWSSSGEVMWSASIYDGSNDGQFSLSGFGGRITDLLEVREDAIWFVDHFGHSIGEIKMSQPQLFHIEKKIENDTETLFQVTCDYPDVSVRFSSSAELDPELWTVYDSPLSILNGESVFFVGTFDGVPLSKVVEVVASLP